MSSNEVETIDTAAVGAASVITSTNSNSKRSSGSSSDNNIVSTIIFDVDDTSYDVSSGFTTHRQGEVINQYMVDHLHFKCIKRSKNYS